MNDRKSAGRLLCLFLVFLLLAGCVGAPSSEDPSPSPSFAPQASVPGGREYYTNLLGGGADTVTIMLYVCGSDLESEYGCATADINEILDAEIADGVNIILETGGAKSWNNSVISNETNQRYQITKDGLICLEADLGQREMTDPETLTDFIRYSAEHFPASRTVLILWDHGGGTLGGYGYDEVCGDGDSMALDELGQALEDAGVQFDFIGFDACLMATAETAFVLEPYADYLIASQKEEPGDGWYYTRWITQLSQNTSIQTEYLAQTLIDDFVSYSVASDPSAEVTLSIIDLTYISPLFDAVDQFFAAAQTELENQNYAEVSRARYNSGVRLQNDYDHVDLIYLASNLNLSGSTALIQAVESCVKYNGVSSDAGNQNGLNIYFPYTDLSELDNMLKTYEAIGFDAQYLAFLTAFTTLMAGGQLDTDWSDYDWYDTSLAESYASYYEENQYDDSLEVHLKDEEYYALSLSDSDWDMITTVETQVLYDDGEGYIDLGSDNVYSFDDDGDLIIEFDNTWVAIDGKIVCFYFEYETDYSADFWYTYGYVPVEVNGEYAEIILQWDDDNPYGYVAGYRKEYSSNVSQKGLFQLKAGDEIDFFCDYYLYDGTYDGVYYWGDTLVVGDAELTVSYEDIGLGECLVYYCLTDIYQNIYYTEPVVFYD